MKKCLYLCVITLFLFIGTDSLFSQPSVVIDKLDTGSIDWTNRTISAAGVSKAPSGKKVITDDDKSTLYKKAKISAAKNLFSTLGRLQIDSKITLDACLTSHPELLNQIQLMINNARVIKKEALTAGMAEVSLQLTIDGGLAQLILPEEIVQIEPIKTLQQTPSESDHIEFTGIVIDARGLKTTPVMSPKIVDENNSEVYGPAFISRENAVQHGMVQYVKEISENERVGNHPVIVTGLKTLPGNQSDIVISTADASKLHSSSHNLDLLHQGKVSIIIDSTPE